MTAALHAIHRELPLIALSGAIGFLLASPVQPLMLLTALIALVVLDILIFARVSNAVAGIPNPDFRASLLANAANYFVVLAVCISPFILISLVASATQHTAEARLVRDIFAVSIAVASVYIVPIVFLKKLRLVAILAGLQILWVSLGSSSRLILLAAISAILGSSTVVGLVAQQSSGQVIMGLTVGSLGLISTFLKFYVFAGATEKLMGNQAAL